MQSYEPSAEPTPVQAPPRTSMCLLAAVGCALCAMCAFPQSALLSLIGPAAGAGLVTYAALTSGLFLLYGLYPASYIAASLAVGNWVTPLPIMFSFLASALLLLVCRRRMAKSRAVMITGAVFAAGYICYFAIMLYSMYGTLSLDVLRSFGSLLHQNYTNMANQLAPQLNLDPQALEQEWQRSKMLLPAVGVVCALVFGWISCTALSLCGNIFSAPAAPRPWFIELSPVTAVLFLVGSLITMLVGSTSVFTLTVANLTVILTAVCAVVGVHALLPRRRGPIRIISPMLFILLFAALFLGIGIAAQLAAFFGAAVTLISAWRNHMTNQSNH